MQLKLNHDEVVGLLESLKRDKDRLLKDSRSWRIVSSVIKKLETECLGRKTPGSRNRQKGHDWERQVVNEFKALGFKDAMSSRAGDRFKDSQGIDILNVPINVQCKRHHNFCSPVEPLKDMPLRGKVNVVFMKIDSVKQGVKEEYAILTTDHFYFMLKGML
uniref:Restriction endonuclease n=1 Tax=viral metagenome TaxID=1070528 RepID=A0A6M3IK78_9ZZZZ